MGRRLHPKNNDEDGTRGRLRIPLIWITPNAEQQGCAMPCSCSSRTVPRLTQRQPEARIH